MSTPQLTDLAVARDVNLMYNELAPISSLPPEILAQIFQVGSFMNSRPGLRFQVLVSHVSQSWRMVALETCILWTLVKWDGPGNLSSAAASLTRSKSMPIDIVIGDNGSPDPSFLSELLAFLQMVEANISRCRRLQINLPIEIEVAETKIMRILVSSSMPVMRSLFLTMVPKHERTRILLNGAPSLECLWLQNLTFADVIPPLANITTFRVEANAHSGDEIEALCSALSDMPCLTHWDLLLFGSHLDFPPRIPHLNALRTLYLTFPKWIDVFAFLRLIVSASLQEITIRTHDLGLHPHSGVTAELSAVFAGNPPIILSLRRLCVVAPLHDLHGLILNELARIFPKTILVVFRNITYRRPKPGRSWLVCLRQLSRMEFGFSIPWPHLEALGLQTLDPGYLETELREFLILRAALGCPIQSIMLSPEHMESGRRFTSNWPAELSVTVGEVELESPFPLPTLL
ncbi:hypothetical protein FIBSPDRAFT_930305 [Athelia psychrophila]|uniref:Uncharacterized protein n=1 Tax=Athelia psychrophila TaxID=1759441 RepID=A0A166MAS7_9AGAM|nr:hypothetical protein FIBSPDRAFT_930305 [Fibularhizoctonia sp. CBS 109695]